MVDGRVVTDVRYDAASTAQRFHQGREGRGLQYITMCMCTEGARMGGISLQVPKHRTRRATSTLDTALLLYSCILKHSTVSWIYHTQLAKMSFDEIFDLTAGVYFNFYNIVRVNTHLRNVRDIWYAVDEAMMPNKI